LERYQLKVKVFTFDMKVDDTIIEPGEEAQINSIYIENEGMMPSPIHQDLLLSAVDNTWVLKLTLFTIPRAIAPLTPISIPANADFKIKYPLQVNTKPEPFSA
jgi:hypothetical protein